MHRFFRIVLYTALALGANATVADTASLDALRVVGKLALFQRATSLGGVESLVEHRHTIEPHTGIPPNLIRISVGIEDLRDLQVDLAQALD